MSFEIFTPTPPVSNINAEYVVSPLYKDDPNVPVINFPYSEITCFPDMKNGTGPNEVNTLIPSGSALWSNSNNIFHSLNTNDPDPRMYFELGPFYISSGGTYQLCINFQKDGGDIVGIWEVYVDNIYKMDIDLSQIFPVSINDGIYFYRESIGILDTGFHTVKIKYKSGGYDIKMFDTIRIVKISN